MTSDKKSTYISNVFYYTFMPFFRYSISFITLPIMTRYLSPDKYGIVTLITMITTFSWMFYFGLNAASQRFYFKYKNENSQVRRLFSTNLFIIIFSGFVYCSTLVVFFPALNSYFFKGQLKIIWIILAFLQSLLLFINANNQSILQNMHRGRNWFMNEAIATVTMVVILLSLVVTRRFTFEAIIISGFVSEAVKSVLLFVQLRDYYGFTFRLPFLKESLAYAWPNTPASLMGFGCTYVDRVLVNKFRGLSQVGVLDISGKGSMLMKTVIDGISGVFSPITLDLLTKNTKESIKELADLFLKVAFLVLFVALMIILFSKELFLLLTTKEYHFAIYVAPIYIYYHVFGVLGMLSYWLIYYHPNKTFWLMPISALAFLISAIANIIFIPRYGLMGAAIAAFLSSGLAQAFQFIVGIRTTPIPLNYFKLSVMFFMLFLGTAILYLLYYLKMNMFLDIGIRLLMLALFMIAGLLLKIVYLNEIKELFIIFRGKLDRILFWRKKIYMPVEPTDF